MIRRFINKAIWLVVHKVPWKPILIWGPWVVVLLVVGFYGIENWRGEKAWSQARKDAEKAGISLNLKDHLPPFTEDSIDASTLPILDGVKTRSFKRRIYDGDKGLADKTVARISTTTKNRWKAEPRDIRVWLDPATGPFTKEESASELRAIAKADLDKLHSLVEQSIGHKIILRPTSSHPTFEEIANIALMPSFGAFELAAEDTLLSLAEKDSERAHRNLDFMLTLIEMDSYPTLISWLITASGIMIFENVLWEAVMSDVLTVEQLRTLDQRIATLDIPKMIEQSLEGELAYMLANFEVLQQDRELLAKTLVWWMDLGMFSKIETDWTPLEEACENVDFFLIKRIPRGWLNLGRAELIGQTTTMKEKLHSGGFNEVESYDFSHDSLAFPANIYSRAILPTTKKAVTRGREPVIRLRLARIGIALTLFNRKHGSYPTSLAILNDSVGLSLIDSYSGNDFGYRLKKDGSPIVWSIGLNRIDENGLPGFRKNEGDIVWQLTPVAGLTESDLKKKLRKHRLKGGASL